MFVEIADRGKKNNKKIVRFYDLIYSENNSKIINEKGEKSYGKQKEICLLHAAFNINIAVRFYLDYLHNKKSVDFISPMLARTIKSEVESVEKNVSEMLYKLAVEQSKLTVALAMDGELERFDYNKLNEYCAQTVAENNGVIDFEEANYYKELYNG